MMFRKIKNMAKSNRGNTTKRTPLQITTATKIMILRNPMFCEISRKKLSKSRQGIKPSKPFPKNNQYLKKRTDIKIPQAITQIPQAETLNTLNRN